MRRIGTAKKNHEIFIRETKFLKVENASKIFVEQPSTNEFAGVNESNTPRHEEGKFLMQRKYNSDGIFTAD